MTPSTPPHKPKSFRATLILAAGPLKWTGVQIPFNAAKLWKQRGQIRVRGSINGFAFRTTLFPAGEGRHFLLVNKTMQKGGRVQRGDTAEFRLELDTEERKLSIPKELQVELHKSKRMQRFYSGLSGAIQKWLADIVGKNKSAAARKRRAEQVAEQLLETMEAERALPPLMARAFEENPKARAGWKRMTAIQRRNSLLAVFFYRNPATRMKRLQKVMVAASAKGS